MGTDKTAVLTSSRKAPPESTEKWTGNLRIADHTILAELSTVTCH
jgi:hypothetical protein